MSSSLTLENSLESISQMKPAIELTLPMAVSLTSLSHFTAVKMEWSGWRRQDSRRQEQAAQRPAKFFSWVLNSISMSRGLSVPPQQPYPNSNDRFLIPWGLDYPLECLTQAQCVLPSLPLGHFTWVQYCCCGIWSLKMGLGSPIRSFMTWG